MASKQKLFIGTSGYSYPHWRKVFYPDGLPQSGWLEYYAEHFTTVELNNTFYHLPGKQNFESWRKRAPKDFTFAVKASRFITHVKKLKDPKPPLRLFMSRAKGLKTKLGPILYQLPPKFKCNLPRLRKFAEALPKGYVHVFEFRDPSWLNEDVYDVLRKNKLGFCIYSMPGSKCPDVVTSNVVYIRMHGGSVLYGSNYSGSELKALAKKVRGFLKKGLKAYVYFNNDARGYAVNNALSLKRLLKS